MLYPRTAGDKVAILKTKLPSETPPQRRAETPGEFQLCLLDASVQHGMASYCPISRVTNWLGYMLQVAASRCVN